MSLFSNVSDVFHDSRSKNYSKYDVGVSRKGNVLFVVTVPLFIQLVNRDIDVFLNNISLLGQSLTLF